MARRSFVSILKALRLKQWIVIAALAGILGMTGYYTARIVTFLVHSRQQGEQTQVRGWMSPRYVAHTNHVPLAVVNEAIGLPADAIERRPLRTIAEGQNRDFEEMRISLTTAIVQYRAAHPQQEEQRR